MGWRRSPGTFESRSDDASSAQSPRTAALNRELFREMVKGEIEDRPLGWLRRRTLIRFAERLGMDSFEARILIRSVEYACGHVRPAAMSECRTPVDREYLVHPSERAAERGLAGLLLLGVWASLLLRWLAQ